MSRDSDVLYKYLRGSKVYGLLTCFNPSFTLQSTSRAWSSGGLATQKPDLELSVQSEHLEMMISYASSDSLLCFHLQRDLTIL